MLAWGFVSFFSTSSQSWVSLFTISPQISSSLFTLSLLLFYIVWPLLISYSPHVFVALCFFHFISYMFQSLSVASCHHLFFPIPFSSYRLDPHTHKPQLGIIQYPSVSQIAFLPTFFHLVLSLHQTAPSFSMGMRECTRPCGSSSVSSNCGTALYSSLGQGWVKTLSIRLYGGPDDCACRQATLWHPLHHNHVGLATHSHTNKQSAHNTYSCLFWLIHNTHAHTLWKRLRRLTTMWHWEGWTRKHALTHTASLCINQ